jgi:hypothetical protein
MVATDAPGRREIMIEGETALTACGRCDRAAAIAKPPATSACARVGANARRLAESSSAEAIGRETVALYDLACCKAALFRNASFR